MDDRYRFLVVATFAALLSAAAPPVLAAKRTVTNIGNSGPGTLRQALLDTNASCNGADTISFNIPTGPFVIALATPLPTVVPPKKCSKIVIDGYSQPGATANSGAAEWNANVVIELDGSALAGANLCGLKGTGFEVKGLVLRNFRSGGTAAALCGGGITSSGNMIVNNDTGFSAGAGSAVGGGSPAVSNLISGNGIGVAVTAATTGPSITISGNFVGTGASGLTGLPNDTGIQLVGNAFTTLVKFNVIAANRLDGVVASGTDKIRLTDNFIGVGSDGLTALGNGRHGILIDNGSRHEVIDNQIAHNGGAGVRIVSGTANVISGNSIYANTLANIDLGAPGNDAGDGDAGPNNLQNSPQIVGLTQDDGVTTIAFSLASASSRSYSIEFFANSVADVREGEMFLGALGAVTTDEAGNASGTATFSGSHDNITATARDNATGDTSEFSPVFSMFTPLLVTFTPAGFDFGTTLVDSRSASREFVIRNSGTALAGLAPLGITGDFILESTTCGASLAPGAGCIAHVAFKPTQPGPSAGSLVASAAAGDALGALAPKSAPRSAAASLFGTGIHEARLEMAAVIDLGTFLVGGAAISQTVTLRNGGTAVLTFGEITASEPFSLANGCPLNLAPGQVCSVMLTFSSELDATASGTLTVLSNAAGGARMATILARAQLVPYPVIRISTGFLAFGDQMLGSRSESQRFSISNIGGLPATLSLGIEREFLLTGTNCGATLPSRDNCFVDVAFKPAGFGPRVGQLLISSNAENGAYPVNLLGIGCRPPRSLSRRLGDDSSSCSP